MTGAWHTRIRRIGRTRALETSVAAHGAAQLLERRRMAEQLARWAQGWPWQRLEARPGASSSDPAPVARQRGDALEPFRAAG